MSRLLDKLRSELRAARSASAVSESRARLSVFYARRGDESEAAVEIAELRSLANSANLATCTAQANLAEGVLAFCKGHQAEALDKLRRAKALAELASSEALVRLCLAWLSHVELNLAQTANIDTQIELILSNARSDEHAALSRIGMTLAIALHTCGRYDLARPWYELSRQHAVAEGDDLTLDALMHNVAAIRIHNLRLNEIAEVSDLSELTRAEQELTSGMNYDEVKSPKSYRWMFPLLRIQLLILQKQINSARLALEEWFSEHQALALPRATYLARIDYSYCLSHSNNLKTANEQIEVVAIEPSTKLDLDDLAFVRFRQSQLAAASHDAGSEQRLLEDAKSLLAKYRTGQASLELALRKIPRPNFGKAS